MEFLAVLRCGRDVGNAAVREFSDGRLKDIPYDVTFVFVFHAFHPEGGDHSDVFRQTGGTPGGGSAARKARPLALQAVGYGLSSTSRARSAWFGRTLSAVLLTLASHSLSAEEFILADPARMLGSAERIDFAGANTFAVEAGPFGLCLRSTPRHSASALYQRVSVTLEQLKDVRWVWKVDSLQGSADIRKLASEDFGAKVMFVFGEPSFFNRDVPTLAYVWTATPAANGSVLPSQRYRSLAYIQLRGRSDAGQWRREARDIAADFRAIFGHEPDPLKFIAIFNDNDQTNEAASALFGPVISGRGGAS